MTVSAHAVANEFIKLAQKEGKSLTNMQLQKLVFISQGYSLAILDRPIYFHNTHAWQFGPVIPKLYKSLQKYGRNVVTDKLKAEDSLSEGSDEQDIVFGVFKAYGHLSGGQLSQLTHKPNTPWSITWAKDQFGVIPHPLIAQCYRELVSAS